MIKVDDVDRVDRGTGVGVRGEQDAPRPGVHVHRAFQELDAVHLRHPVVGQDHRDLVAAQLQLGERVQRRLAGLGAHDPVLAAVAAPQITGHGAGHVRVVVDGQDRDPTRVGGCVRRHGRSVGSSGVRRPRRRCCGAYAAIVSSRCPECPTAVSARCVTGGGPRPGSRMTMARWGEIEGGIAVEETERLQREAHVLDGHHREVLGRQKWVVPTVCQTTMAGVGDRPVRGGPGGQAVAAGALVRELAGGRRSSAGSA